MCHDLIADCCYEDYRDKKREYIERTVEDRAVDALEDNENAQFDTNDSTCKEQLWKAFEAPHSTTASLVFYYVTGFFITVSVTANVVETLHCESSVSGFDDSTYGDRYRDAFFCLDTACVLIFTVEYLMRLYCCPSRLKFVTSAMSLIDVVAILPYYITLFINQNSEF